MWKFTSAFAAIVLWTSAAIAADTESGARQHDYFSVDLGKLVTEFDEAHIVSDPLIRTSFYQRDSTPHLRFPPKCEAYLLMPETTSSDFRGVRVIGRKPRGEAISGAVFLLQRHPDQPQRSVLAKFDVEVSQQPAQSASREDFLRAQGRAMSRLWSEGVAGSAVFRHRATHALGELGEEAEHTGPQWPVPRRTGVDQTIRMSSGGRAVSENLRLDQQINLPQAGEATLVPISKIEGITVREIEWDSLLADEDPEPDPLARLIPHDQYAVLMNSFQSLLELVDQGDRLAKPMVQWIETDSRRRDVMAFYQRQMGLPLNTLTRQFGGAMVRDVAITGGDPYFRTGTDVAVLMRSEQPQLLFETINAMIASEASLDPLARQLEQRHDGHRVVQWSREDRRISSFSVRIDDTVIVTNSMAQLKKLLSCAEGATESLQQLDEYRFFRQRYPRSSPDESALVIISDATIRRWCGPTWRIAASRRTRARATIADMTVRHADALVRDQVSTISPIHPSETTPDAGTLWLTSSGIRSETYGTLDFQTPINEMDLAYVTEEEKELYEQWRRGYERQWSRVFDPIAVQCIIKDERLSADLSVIPLVVQTQYRFLRDLMGESRLDENAGDPHPDTFAQAIIAVDPDSPMLTFVRGALANNAGPLGGNIVGWLDNSVSIYFDRDQQWLERFQNRDRWEWELEDSARDLPVGVFFPSRNNLQMSGFIVALRGMIDQSAPNLIRWETRQHKGLQYLRGRFDERNGGGLPDEVPDLFYVTTPAGLTISTNERVVQRAIERQSSQGENKKKGDADHQGDAEPQSEKVQDTSHPSARKRPQLVFTVTGEGLQLAAQQNYQSGLRRMHHLAWSNIPIMNYFRKQYPNQDPRQVYVRLFGEELVEPAGGEYKWNERFGTYESTHYGFHLLPEVGPVLIDSLAPEDRLETTLSFQDGGLRATATISRAP